ncbi:MAG: OOP family OmpA-OmpF porin [Paracoccaceae bacterium]|jgi:OOP family OmpA-OmpF porin
MQRLALFIGAIAIAVAAAVSFLSATFIVDYVERSTTRDIVAALKADGFDWASVRADGLVVHVSGAAPKEAQRFNALASIKRIVKADRVTDAIKVADPDDLRAPIFSLELLRNDDGISLIGLVPDKSGREAILGSIDDIDHETTVTDMLETADYPEPEGWNAALEFALSGLKSLPRSKISVRSEQVTITAITDSQEEKSRIEALLNSDKPENVVLVMRISAPRPVITPFSLRFIKEEAGVRFDSCSADDENARAAILKAARAAGLDDGATCNIGLGAPTPHWGTAAELAIHALDELGGGSLTFSDADITLVATTETRQIDFDRIIHNLEQALPDVFSVHAVLPPKPVLEGQAAATAPPEFVVTKSPEGLVQIRGRLRDERTKTSVNNFAKATFGGENVYDTTRTDPTLPDGWPLRILAGLDALGRLHHGILIVSPEMLEIRGTSSRPEVSTEVTQSLSEKLGEAVVFEINITYEAALNKVLLLPTPGECVDNINTILTTGKIVFAPSSTKLDVKGFIVVTKIAEAMVDCSEVPMEIGGHTDSQGRENMNQTLSQARAEAVLDGLLSNDVLTTYLSAKGYGESQPIADNATEEGRATNRRIEFKLLTSDASNQLKEASDQENTNGQD